MSERELRGFSKSPDYSRQKPSWETLDTAGKVQKSIELMSNPKFVGKRGRASGEDALILKIENEPGLAAAILELPEGREAVVSFVKFLFRSEGYGHASQGARRVLELFSFEMTPEEEKEVRDAELDCRAYVIGNDPYPDDSWLEGLTEEERIEVEKRAEIHKQRIRNRENR